MKTIQVHITISAQRFLLDPSRIEVAVGEALPEPLKDHYVVVGGRRFPPKQVISAVTGLDRADFTTHQARRILRRLGFPVGRKTADQPLLQTHAARAGWPHGGREAEALRGYTGKWVAQRDLDVLVAADTPQEVVAWLQRYGQRADGVFRVPRDASETEVLALE